MGASLPWSWPTSWSSFALTLAICGSSALWMSSLIVAAALLMPAFMAPETEFVMLSMAPFRASCRMLLNSLVIRSLIGATILPTRVRIGPAGTLSVMDEMMGSRIASSDRFDVAALSWLVMLPLTAVMAVASAL